MLPRRYRPRRRTITQKIPNASLAFLLVVVCILFPLLILAAPSRDHPKEPSRDGPVIGIDLGTTNSCVSIHRNGSVEIIPNELGGRTTPSYVAFLENGQRIVGQEAKYRAVIDPENTVFDIKRVIGLPFNDPTVQDNRKNYFPFRLESQHSKPVVKIGRESYSPEEISATILSQLKLDAERYLGEPVSNAVISVPAWFNDAQRAATKDAGRLAGMNVLRLVNEPTAAALAYGLDKEDTWTEEKTFVVYDLGGGTFDVSVVEADSGVFEVLATGGDTHLGGEDFDNRIIAYLVSRWNLAHPNHEVKDDPAALSKLRIAVEEAKCDLSDPNTDSVPISINAFKDGMSFTSLLSRRKFNELNEDLFQQTMKTLDSVIKDSKAKEIEDIVLIGGSTRIPRIRQLLQERFPGKKIRSDINPDETVSVGASKVAWVMSGDSDPLLGLFDISPLTLGVDANGVLVPVIPRNSIIPNKRSKIFTTTKDNQESVTVRVLEGDRAQADMNNFLGSLTLSGIEPAPRGEAQIEVTFVLDVNNMLQVKAVDLRTGKFAEAVIENEANRLSYDEMERMLEAANKYREQDDEFRKVAELRSQLDLKLHNLQKALTEDRFAVSRKEKAELQQQVRDQLQWMASSDGLQATSDELHDRLSRFEAYALPPLRTHGHPEL